ncbi:hypothetical protein MMPV_002015 [Pyropia vietnamensis]
MDTAGPGPSTSAGVPDGEEAKQGVAPTAVAASGGGGGGVGDDGGGGSGVKQATGVATTAAGWASPSIRTPLSFLPAFPARAEVVGFPPSARAHSNAPGSSAAAATAAATAATIGRLSVKRFRTAARLLRLATGGGGVGAAGGGGCGGGAAGGSASGGHHLKGIRRLPSVSALLVLNAALLLLVLLLLWWRRGEGVAGGGGSGGGGVGLLWRVPLRQRPLPPPPLPPGSLPSLQALLATTGGVAASAPLVINSPREARLAYFIQLDGRSLPLLPRLLHRLHHPDNLYVLHVDGKVDTPAYAAAVADVRGAGQTWANVHFLRREYVTYKGVSMVTNALAAMRLALALDDGWEYIINLSGADYPLVSAVNQRRLLGRPGVGLPPGALNFFSFFPRAEWSSYAFRVNNLHFDPAVVGYQGADARLRRLRAARFNPVAATRNYTLVKAEAWMIASRPLAAWYVADAGAKQALLNAVNALSPAEHYFASAAWNDPRWAATLVPDALRKVVWRHAGRRSGQHPYALDRTPGGAPPPAGAAPFAFWAHLHRTRSLFARKVTLPHSALMERMDVELSGLGVGGTLARGPAAASAVASNRAFLLHLTEHFDFVTTAALRAANVSIPLGAYPPVF